MQTHYIPVYWHPFYRQMGYKGSYAPGAEEFYTREIESTPFIRHCLKKISSMLLKTNVLNTCATVCEIRKK